MSCVGRRSAVVAKRFALGREVGQGHGVTIWVDGGEHVSGRVGAVANGPVGGVKGDVGGELGAEGGDDTRGDPCVLLE